MFGVAIVIVVVIVAFVGSGAVSWVRYQQKQARRQQHLDVVRQRSSRTPLPGSIRP
jgi:type II secretory pathway pseudopilin PulG